MTTRAMNVATTVLFVLSMATATSAQYTMAEGFNENAKGTVTQYKVYENQTDLGTDYGHETLSPFRRVCHHNDGRDVIANSVSRLTRRLALGVVPWQV